MLEIRRREFIAGLGGAAAWPLSARAQPGDRVRRIGVLSLSDENDPATKADLSAFTQGRRRGPSQSFLKWAVIRSNSTWWRA